MISVETGDGKRVRMGKCKDKRKEGTLQLSRKIQRGDPCQA